MKISKPPWRTGFPGSVRDADGNAIAMAYDGPGPAVRDANARLMASAPAMLELLRLLAPGAPEKAKPALEAFLKSFE